MLVNYLFHWFDSGETWKNLRYVILFGEFPLTTLVSPCLFYFIKIDQSTFPAQLLRFTFSVQKTDSTRIHLPTTKKFNPSWNPEIANKMLQHKKMFHFLLLRFLWFCSTKYLTNNCSSEFEKDAEIKKTAIITFINNF